MNQAGIFVPDTVVLTVDAYAHFLSENLLKERVTLELSRKPLEEMRWEEVWDTALRIRHMFLSHPITGPTVEMLRGLCEGRFRNRPLVVRSSAPGEDDAQSSFAGLHESFVNVRGLDAVIDRVRQVWASLWSDAALLYRREMGLDVESSAMAVIIQVMVDGNRSGVVFSRNPVDDAQGVVEAVYGLNQGLVDGTVAPDRWVFVREGRRMSHHPPENREQAVFPHGDGIRLQTLPAHLADKPPLTVREARKVFDLGMALEVLFGHGVDSEWTFEDQWLVVLQARPVTTGEGSSGADQRPWYLSLRRSFDSLQDLRRQIETEYLPEMARVADSLASVDLGRLDNDALADEIARRSEINAHWNGVYWRDFIPMAHGARLFGQVYNDRVKPESPFEFLSLLTGTDLKSLARNRRLLAMGERLRQMTPDDGDSPDYSDESVWKELDAFLSDFGGTHQSGGGPVDRSAEQALLASLLKEFARSSPEKAILKPQGSNSEALKRRYLESFPESEIPFGEALLDLARASYRLRDDDNIVLGRIEAQLNAALEEARHRLAQSTIRKGNDRLVSALGGAFGPTMARSASSASPPTNVRARQLVGQPAGVGIARGPARVVGTADDLFAFKAGEVLVCDAVDPNMTFVVPLAAAVVERRGGMLIHGAIIAREYGLPCITGVPEATGFIRTGDWLTVDGYLGIIYVDTPSDGGD
jgi:pyruvate,water dikinase